MEDLDRQTTSELLFPIEAGWVFQGAAFRFNGGHHSELTPVSFRLIAGRVTGAAGDFWQVSPLGISAFVITHEERLMPRPG